MEAQNNWNYERYRTRDLLLEYDLSIMPPHPRAAGLAMVYPWEKTPLQFLCEELYQLAAKSGYEGTKENFQTHFGEYFNEHNQIICDRYINFPIVGEINKLYFDLDEKILYYWDNQYLPVNATLIANTIIDCGTATI